MITLASCARGRGGDQGQRRRDAVHRLAHPLRDHRRGGLAQVREPAVHRRVQGARRAEQAAVRSPTRSAPPACWRCRPATTPRRSPITPQRLGIRATIVMPRFTPHIKVERTRGFGAEVILSGETFDEARRAGLGIAAERGGDAGPSLRRSAGDRRPGNDRAGDARGRAAARDARRPGRRRRDDRRHRGRGEGAAAGHRDRRRRDERLPGGALCPARARSRPSRARPSRRGSR